MYNSLKPLSTISTSDIEEMDYNNLISLVRETNRIPGGYKTIISIVQNSFLTSNSRILEIGTSTGSTSIEIAKLLHCKIDAIDINKRSINEAKKRAEIESVSGNIVFSVGDAQKLFFSDKCFNCVICGNVTSLIKDREKALSEYVRVMDDNAILAAVPMYYREKPSEKLLSDVQDAIQTKVEIMMREDWIRFYNHSGLVLKCIENYRFDYIDDSTLNEFIAYILNQDFLKELQPDVFECLCKKYRKYLYLFRENLSHMGYSILLYKKEPHNKEPELFRGSFITE